MLVPLGGDCTGTPGAKDTAVISVKTVILAGGLGTRLRPVVADRPKVMADVGGRPFLEYQIEELVRQGFRDIVLCVGHMHEQIQQYFGDGGRWGADLVYGVEREPLGTAGAIRNVQQHIDDRFMVLNGDSYLELDFSSMASIHKERVVGDRAVLGTIVTVTIEDASAYGTVELDESGRIVSFREKSQGGPGSVNGGIYMLEPDVLDRITPGRAVSIEKEVFPSLLRGSKTLWSFPAAGPLIDIGTPDGYERFQRLVGRRNA